MQFNILEVAAGAILGFGGNVLAALGQKWIVSPWELERPSWARRTLKPGLRGARHLRRLQVSIGNMVEWLGANETPLVSEIVSGLWREMAYLKIEELSYIAIYTDDSDWQLWAVGQISQMKNEAKARSALEAIAAAPNIRRPVREFVQKALDGWPGV